MLSIDPVKLLLVLVVAMVVLGPDKLPQAARRISSFLGDVQRWRASMESHARQVVDDLPFADDLRDAGQALHRVRGVADPRQVLHHAVGSPATEHEAFGAHLPIPEPTAIPAPDVPTAHVDRPRHALLPVPGDPHLN